MDMFRKSPLEFLVNDKLITQEQLDHFLKNRSQFRYLKLTQLLVTMELISEEALKHALSRHTHIPEIDLKAVAIESEVIELLSENIARRHVAMPLKLNGDQLTLAISDPYDLYAIEAVEIASGYRTDLVLATESEIINAIDRHYTKSESEEAPLSDLLTSQEVDSEVEVEPITEDETKVDLAELTKDEPLVIRLVNTLIHEAIRLSASDIHIEPRENRISIRYRIDGILRQITSFNKSLFPKLIARIKVMSRMDISVQYRPQDGRSRVHLSSRQVDLRVSSLPTMLGEKVVIRILDKARVPKSLNDIGLLPEEVSHLRTILKIPHGAIIATGPTGSGKTSTLFAMLNELNSEEVNIVTVEDPIEYELDGINQVQVNERRGMTFASGLRSILRQDPDTVMVGEMRDSETAEIAFRAALTGHRVLSTLHTNTALYSISRLIDMGVQPYLIASALIAVIAQRLVRRICNSCKESYKPDKDELSKKFGLQPDYIPNELFRGKGCQTCDFTGYKGRVGVFEIVEINDQLRELIGNRADSYELFRAARSSGMKTLAEDALRKLFIGLTTVEEVERMIKLTDVDISLVSPVVQPKSEGEAVALAEVEEPEPEASAAAAVKKTKLLLISTDVNLKSILDQETDSAYSVMVANESEEILRSVFVERPDLIIADVQMMPDYGERLFEELKSHLQTMSIPILSIFPNEDLPLSISHILHDLMDNYLIKPLDPKELLNKVASILTKDN
jgi:type IV pilus assembly protein PilB